jgi:hypothetical protein
MLWITLKFWAHLLQQVSLLNFLRALKKSLITNPSILCYQLVTAAQFLRPVDGPKIEKINIRLPEDAADVRRNAEKNIM